MALLDQLISFWPLNEASGQAKDAHGAYHLTDNNTVAASGSSRDFERDNNEYFSIAATSSHELSFGDEDFTFACWVNFESLPSYIALIAKDSSYELGYDADTTALHFSITSSTWASRVKANLGSSPGTGTWIFCVGWYDATANTVNIQANNGTPVSASQSGGAVQNNENLRIGGYANGVSTHDGLMNRVMCWNRVLTSDERTWLYNAGSGRSYRELVLESGGAVYRSHATTDYGTRTNTTVNAPSGVTDGDELLMVFVIGASTEASIPTPTFPAGWSVVDGPFNMFAVSTANFTYKARLLRKRASSEGASYTITHASASTECLIAAVQGGADATPAFSRNSGQGNVSSSAPDNLITYTSITPAVARAAILAIGLNWDGFGTNAGIGDITPPTGDTPAFTEQRDNNGYITYLAEGVLDPAGATGNKTMSNANFSGGTPPWAGYLIAVEPPIPNPMTRLDNGRLAFMESDLPWESNLPVVEA